MTGKIRSKIAKIWRFSIENGSPWTIIRTVPCVQYSPKCRIYITNLSNTGKGPWTLIFGGCIGGWGCWSCVAEATSVPKQNWVVRAQKPKQWAVSASDCTPGWSLGWPQVLPTNWGHNSLQWCCWTCDQGNILHSVSTYQLTWSSEARIERKPVSRPKTCKSNCNSTETTYLPTREKTQRVIYRTLICNSRRFIWSQMI